MASTFVQSPTSRLVLFSTQYLIQGLVLGIIAEGLTANLKLAGIEASFIGVLMSAYYLTLSGKWLLGPATDLLFRGPLARVKRALILANLVLAAALCLAAAYSLNLPLWYLSVLVVCIAAAVCASDVITDAIAVSNTPADQRGRLSGYMFTGMNVGLAAGGSGSLYLASRLNFSTIFLIAACLVALQTLAVVCRLPLPPPESSNHLGVDRSAPPALRGYIASFLSLLRSSRSRWALLFAFLPPGAMALSMPLQIALGVDVGYSEDDLANLNLWTAIASMPATLLGGWLADRYGAVKTFAWSVLALTLPSVALAILLANTCWYGTHLPAESARHALFASFWVICLMTALAGAVMVAARSAVCIRMAVREHQHMATHFTALMALSNLANSFAAAWQGYTIDRFGYAPTLAADVVLGLAILALLLHPTVRGDQPRVPS